MHEFSISDALRLLANRGTSIRCRCKNLQTGEEFEGKIFYPESGSDFGNEFVISKSKDGGYSMSSYNPEIYQVMVNL